MRYVSATLRRDILQLGDDMKKLLLASIAGLALASGSAFAADLPVSPVYKALPPPPPPAYTWTGCYVDGGFGFGMNNQDSHSEWFPGLTPLGAQVTNGGRGWLGRVGGGCDYQVGPILSGNLVIGVLADYDFMNLKGKFGDPSGPVTGNEKETGAWYVGPRIGYAVTPGFLTYFDGGYTQTSFGQLNFNTAFGVPVGIDIAATTYHGWFLGGGTDTSLAGLLPGLPAGLFLRSEYRYSTYEAADDPIVTTATGASIGVAEHVQKYTQTITTALVWKFNWLGH
jgi:outer membrane immunogenic protein